MSLLNIENVSKRFGGVQAVNSVSLHLEEGEILGIIGPNGAGKTTLFNLVTGTIRSDTGSITLDGTDITATSPTKRARAGIGRTFQVVRPFLRMTVVENVMVPVLVHTHKVSEARRKAIDLLDELGIGKLANKDVSQLTLAQRKRVEVARALATDPKVLLLDEVLAGLNTREVLDVLPFVTEVRARGVSIIMIEHLVKALTSVSDRIIVLDQGTLIAEGKSEDVLKNPAVITAYIGDDKHAES
ncbi:ABC transporter ATP-binding protein [Arthrobacter sp. TB 23]|uniref:ABC transporter ATP-binding protein n=1 Tax=Arthrobacter sp. TB 23 TaxID=494419 RepID=UPI0002F55C03|nr:ABC transporter ATP-binding protein [Arthrobacter sp. TB 23]